MLDKKLKLKYSYIKVPFAHRLKWWAEYFRELLNYPPPENPQEDISTEWEELDVNLSDTKYSEIWRQQLLNHLNNNAAGIDEITEEMVKDGGQSMSE